MDDYKRLKVLLVWRHNEVRHLFSKEVTQLLEDFTGPYDAEMCAEFWDKEWLDEFGKRGEASSRRFKFILLMLGCTRETWVNVFYNIYPALEHRLIVVRTNRVQPSVFVIN